MSQSALEIFDVYSTLLVSIALFATLPLAIFVYSQLVFSLPYSRNFTFRLIAFNGMTPATQELLSGVSFLVINQISSFAFARFFFSFLSTNRTVDYALRSFDYLLRGLALHSALFVALNRLKTMVYIKRKGNDALFVSVSILISFILSSLKIIDLFIFSNQYYVKIDFGSGPFLYPKTDILDQTLRTLADVETAVASGATLAVNLLLAILLTRRGNVEAESNRKIRAERGLVITSVFSFIFYAISYTNNKLARNLNIPFCSIAQFTFIALASITPFWCLMLFVSSIRRFAFRISTLSKNVTDQVQITTTVR